MARISPEAAPVCQLLYVSWNCRPGSAHIQAAWTIFFHRSRAWMVFTTSPEVLAIRSQVRSFSTASMKASVTRMELLAFMDETVL